jgi:hypothetical protein
MRAAVLALALAATALTGFPGPAEARSRLRYSDAYKAYLCEYHELMRRYHPAKRKDSREAARERAGEREEGLTQLRERYRDAIQFPYPLEFVGYTPKRHELLGLDRGWSPDSCEWARKLPIDERPNPKWSPPNSRYECRLDRVIFRDPKSGARVLANAAQLSLSYVLDYKGENQTFLGDPPPLSSPMQLS